MRLTSVLPMLRTENMLGALISYQSFFVNGSTLRARVKHTRNHPSSVTPPRNPTRARSHSFPFVPLVVHLARSRRHRDDIKIRKIFHPPSRAPRDDDDDDTASPPRVFVVIARATDQSPRTDPSSSSPSHRDARRETRAREQRLQHVRLLLAALLALGHSLILTDRHDDSRARVKGGRRRSRAREMAGGASACVRITLYTRFYVFEYVLHVLLCIT